MCLALYANGMLRLWNMLDARCIFKKVGLKETENEDEDADEIDSEDSSEEDVKNTLASKFANTP